MPYCVKNKKKEIYKATVISVLTGANVVEFLRLEIILTESLIFKIGSRRLFLIQQMLIKCNSYQIRGCVFWFGDSFQQPQGHSRITASTLIVILTRFACRSNCHPILPKH